LGSNRGFSFAVNRGVEAARAELVAVVNNDVEFEPAWTERLVESLNQSRVWFAVGKLMNAARRDEIDGVGDAICRGGTACRLGHGRKDCAFFYTPRATFFPSATALVARRELFERAGNLEEELGSYLEDVDLGLRLALLGLEGIYVPQAVAYHQASATLGAWSPTMVRWLTRNQILLLAKFYPWRLIWQMARPILAAQGLWAAMAVRRGCATAYLRGLAAGLVCAASLRRSTRPWRDRGNRLAEILRQSEAELAWVQSTTGWDSYWRWYFRLAPHGPEPGP